LFMWLPLKGMHDYTHFETSVMVSSMIYGCPTPLILCCKNTCKAVFSVNNATVARLWKLCHVLAWKFY